MKNKGENKHRGTSNVCPSTTERDSSFLSNIRIVELFEGGRGKESNPTPEILHLFNETAPGRDRSFLQKTNEDLTDIFQGRYKGFRYSTVKYHDLRHTRNVTLAAARLLHGLYLQSRPLAPDIQELCLICAFFHDTGMLLTTEDTAQTGSAYLKSHEERSTIIVQNFLRDNNHLIDLIDSCEPIINCTNLTIAPETIQFGSEEIRIAGYILGSADILAQMADRYYLESLPLLYQEQLDAGIELHKSSLELMSQTTKFYHEVIEHRLHSSFNDICELMQLHFRERWNLDRNLYMEQIKSNIIYLEDVLEKHDQMDGEINDYLRRKQPDNQ